MKPPVSSKLTRFTDPPPPPSWSWDAVRQTKLVDGTEIIRHTLVLQDAHIGIQTLSMGPIQRYDVGRLLVVDVYRNGNTIDIIQDVKPKRHRAEGQTERIEP